MFKNIMFFFFIFLLISSCGERLDVGICYKFDYGYDYAKDEKCEELRKLPSGPQTDYLLLTNKCDEQNHVELFYVLKKENHFFKTIYFLAYEYDGKPTLATFDTSKLQAFKLPPEDRHTVYSNYSYDYSPDFCRGFERKKK